MLLLPTLGWGGAEKQALLFAQYLKEKGIDVIIGSFSEEGIVEKKCLENKIKCYRLPNRKDFFYLCVWGYVKICSWIFRKNKYILRDIYSLYSLVKKEKITHIISYCAVPGTIAGTLKKYIPNLCVTWFQRDAGIYNGIPEYQSYAIKNVDCVLANSISGKEWIQNNYGRDATIIYNGIVMPEAKLNKKEWLEKLGKTEQSLIVTMVANLSSSKDHITLLKAWKKVTDNMKASDIVLVLAGRYDDKYQELKRFVADNKLQRKVIFLGLEDDIVGLLEASTLFAFSAISEGTSNAIAEASMCGLCVVATNLPEIRNILSDENKGLLFEKGNCNDCAEKLVYALLETEERKKIGELNKRKAENMFQREKNFDEIIGVVNNGSQEARRKRIVN